MGMNIKNPRTHELARELAALTGESLTHAVTVAVQERLDRVRAEQTEDPDLAVRRMLEIAKEIREHLPPGALDVDHGELLYDEDGLPK
ncbi:MAG: antitoxin [Propionibacteriales bacterium]|nr:antitoxin [Propionibacteriales bacterium]